MRNASLLAIRRLVGAGFMGMLGCVSTGGISLSAWGAEAPSARFVQDRFLISFWVDPPVDEKAEERYREIAEANFTVALGGFGAKSSEQISRQLDLCEKHGLKAIVPVPGRKMENLASDHPALWGYQWVDEPQAPAFAGLARDVEQVRAARPGKLLYINLLPDYATQGQLGNPTYEEHVKQFVDVVKPDVLSMDHYPLFKPGQGDGRDGYCRNLAVMRSESLRAGIPFWNFFNCMPYGPHTDPTEAQLRWQIYASVAYGAKGVMYFCYYTPQGGEFPKGGAIIAVDGHRTRHYEEAKRLNAELKNLGPTLMKLTSTRTVRVAPDSGVASVLSGGPIRNLKGAPEDPKPDYLVGEFAHQDGRRAVLLQNYHFAYSAWPTVEFDAPADKVVEVDKVTGRERPVRDESPDMEGLQAPLDAGEGRLFILPPTAAK